MEKIILASSSPRRRELMAQAGFAFEVLVSEADETIETETPGEMVEVLSKRKAAAVAEEIKKQGFTEASVRSDSFFDQNTIPISVQKLFQMPDTLL